MQCAVLKVIGRAPGAGQWFATSSALMKSSVYALYDAGILSSIGESGEAKGIWCTLAGALPRQPRVAEDFKIQPPRPVLPYRFRLINTAARVVSHRFCVRNPGQKIPIKVFRVMLQWALPMPAAWLDWAVEEYFAREPAFVAEWIKK
jgi:hypothetical protein